jgi:prepilin-type N-terminal cleavage/methylation domain-containing protein
MFASPSIRPNRPLAAQRGFSLIEVSIVAAIILLAAIVGIPAIGTYVIENKVPEVGRELQRFVARTKANAQGGGPTPYVDIDTGALANAVRDSSALSVSGTGAAALVAHGLGGAGTAGNGVVTVEPVVFASGGAGSGFAVTLNRVSHAACPALASVMQRSAEIISVQGQGGAVVVKDSTASPPLAYMAARAEAQCVQGDNNTFVFTVR